MCGSHDEVNEYRGQDGVHLEVGHVVGLTKEVRVGRYVIDFVEVSRLLVPRGSGLFLLRGVPYSRTRNMGGRLASYKNEVCQVLEVDSDDPRSPVEQATVELTINDVKPEPRVLHRTNKPFPECRFDPASYISSQDREDRAPLTCRWVHTSYYPDKRFRRARRPVDGEVLAHFKEGDVEKNRHRTSDTERTRDWRRGSYTKGGSLVPQGKEEVADAKPGGDGRLPRLAGQKYTVADMFSGAGGYTCGAKMAGFRVVCAVDHWPRCNATYRANHPEVELHEADIMAYCNDLTVDHEPVDLVHLSPPCQTWSPAHTCAGKHDEANIAALYACQYIVEMLRPRFLTLEQTFGIVQDRYLPFFNALVQSLTRYGYSLMWRVLPLVAFGLPQTRKRLVMIGAAPGQPLPDWPKPTHSDSPGAGQRQLVSAIRACRRLVDGEDLHDASGARILDRPPWNGSLPMNRTITTSGGQAYHWSGQRELTLAEFARLQGFPDGYKLVGPCVKKQIGNAFPPVVVHQLLKHMRRWLEEIDCIRNRPDTSDVISISSNDDEKD
ncbi:S-adenosyl-L-methionine-dependent methyltransferase, partial [Cryphonectria parasitica EP155]